MNDDDQTAALRAGAAVNSEPAPGDLPWADFLTVLADESREDMSRRKQDRSKRREQEILRASLRVFARDGISRAVYAAMHGRRLLVLHVFVKKTQATPRKALETARIRLENAT
jgi:hypothetical protein